MIVIVSWHDNSDSYLNECMMIMLVCYYDDNVS